MAGLALGGFVLSNNFRNSVQSDFDERLKFYLDGMIAAGEPNAQGEVSLSGRFADARFERAYSGWYWEIIPVDSKDSGDGQISRSLFDYTIRPSDLRTGGKVVYGYAQGPDQQRVRYVAQRLEFPITASPQPNDVRAYYFLVAGNMTEVEAEVAQFNGTLIWSFALLGVGLVGGIFIQVLIGLQPLRRVSEALARIREGRARRLEGRFPSEIEPLAAELNSLIEHSAEVVGRARTHVSNLAHFLKTPLTVLSSEAAASPGPLADSVQRQVDTMRRQVDHYLARARAAGAVDALGNRTPVKPVLEDLARVLLRIHQDRGLDISIDCPPHLSFRGERQDLEEMAGNLMDNACKWARHRVAVIASRLDGPQFDIRVDDDGPGLDPHERTLVGERGERLDESVPGSGLGLAIVRDIAKLYGGALSLGDSPLGGLETRLVLPVIA
ncbi:MAG TPA: sensor histidine kinase [Rhizomicrobium sp.]|nr:sensor histidine kinase [Rhizomicrobium sp.]